MRKRAVLLLNHVPFKDQLMKNIYLILCACIWLITFSTNAQAQTPVRSDSIDILATRDVPGQTNSWKASGSYQIHYGDGKTSPTAPITRPVIVVEGWDPQGEFEHLGIYNLLDNGLGTSLYDADYDVITLNLHNPSWSIRNNAMLFIELVEEINRIKQGNEEIVVIGFSMGGLIARYGLRHMEDINVDHETRLYVSYDSPHQGATIPKGLELMAQHVAGMEFTIAGQPIVRLRNQSQAIQDLYNLLHSSSVNELLKSSPLSIAAELDAMGYPEDLRKVAVSNGSSRGLRQRRAGSGRLSPGDQLFNWNANNVFFGLNGIISGNINLRVAQQGVRIADVDVDFDPLWSAQLIDMEYYANSNDIPYEIYSGGFYEVDEILGNVANVLPGAQNFMRDGFNFVPFASALDINSAFEANREINLNLPGAGIPGQVQWDILCYSPFDNIIAAPLENERHLAMTARTANWIFDEIQEDPDGVLCRNFCAATFDLEHNSTPLCNNQTRVISLNQVAAGNTVNWTVGPGLTIEGPSNGSAITVRANGSTSNNTAQVTASISTSCDFWGATTASTTVTLGNLAPLSDITYDNDPFPNEICLPGGSTTLHFGAGISNGADYYSWESDLPGFINGISYGVATKFTVVNVPLGYSSYHYVRVRAHNACGVSAWTTRWFNLEYDPANCGDGEGGVGGPGPFSRVSFDLNDLPPNLAQGTIKMYDHSGKLVYQGAGSFDKLKDLDESKVPNGHYFIHIVNKNGIIRKQILLERER